MPGHKGKDVLGLGNIFEIDFTEIDGLDNMHFPKGVIEKSQKLMAECFGSDRSFFLVNGSSVGIMAAVTSVCGKDEIIICQRNSHISFFNALNLCNAIPAYINSENLSISGEHLTKDQIISALGIENTTGKKIRAVYITSPSYQGEVLDVESIAEVAHNNGALLIVDEAHGSHFKFSDKFPKTAMECGADIVIQSHHKTLAVMGQGAVLHVKGNRVNINKLSKKLSIMQTTSPSYAIMASLDRNRELLQKEGNEIFRKYTDNLIALRNAITDIEHKGFKLIGKREGIFDYDIGKILLYTNGRGRQLERFLRIENNIYAEMSTSDYVLLMTSFADDLHDYEALINALKRWEPNRECRQLSNYNAGEGCNRYCQSQKTSMVTIESAAGKICSNTITPYPPGIPIILENEVFTDEILCQIRKKWEDGEVLGVETDKNGKLYVPAKV